MGHEKHSPTRRAVIGDIAIGLAAGTLAAGTEPALAQTERKTFVLVHGSSAGGWCYRRVADILEKQGHKVFAPTLTGLGERSHLMSGMITLDTHIADVVNVIRWENLDNFVLVGHSYGGWIISGAAEQVEKKIAAIVFLDAFMPENGQRVLDTNSPRSRAEIEDAMKRAEVSRPAPHPSVWKVNEKDQPWVQEKFTAQPIGVAFTPIRLTGARDRVPKKTYVRATGYDNPNFEKAYAKVKADPSWRTFEMPCGHEVMIDMPERTAELLLSAAMTVRERSLLESNCEFVAGICPLDGVSRGPDVKTAPDHLPVRAAASSSAVGHPSAGRPDLICSSLIATRLLRPSTPSTRPTSYPRFCSSSCNSRVSSKVIFGILALPLFMGGAPSRRVA